MKQSKTKKWTAWAGFRGGKISSWPCTDAYPVPAEQLEIFTTRKAAKARFIRVEKVEIRIVTKEAKQ